MGENLLKRTGLGPNWDEHDAATCLIINYFADRNNTALILVRQGNEIGKNCYFCNICKNCKRLKECRDEFKGVGFWTFNKYLRVSNVSDPEWLIKNRVFSMKVVV